MPTYTPFPDTAPTLNGVPYVELEGLEEGNNERGGWARKPYLVNFGDRFLFVQGLRGVSRLPAAGGTGWTRGYPYTYPEDPSLFCLDCHIRPEGEMFSTVPISYPYAIVTATFGAPTWDPNPLASDMFNLNQFEPTQPIAYATQELDVQGEWVEIPQGKAYFGSSMQLLDHPVSRRVTVMRMVITFHQLPYMPITGFRNLADKVNDATFLGCARGTVMCEGPKTVRERSSDNTIVQKLTFALKWRSFEWNAVINKQGQPEMIYYADNAGAIDPSRVTYPYQDFSPLLYVGQSL
jgi:hypothetical protein